MAVSLMHGWTSYTRRCNVAVCLLVGDVGEATVVLNCCGFAAQFGALEPDLNSKMSGLALLVRVAQTFTRIQLSLVLVG